MKLAIISHTEHYKTSDGTIVGWGPTIIELNHLAEDFEEVYHIAFLHPDTPPPSSLEYAKENIHFIALEPVGGSGIVDKLNIITRIPNIINTVRNTLNKVDVFQLRTPTGIGIFLIPYLSLFCNKKGWFKYAGNWNQDNPPLGYALQRWMLKKQKRKVTINGLWPEQPAHCLTFENPCLTNSERQEGFQVSSSKSFQPPFTFCFVGRLEDEKGVQRIIDAFAHLKSTEKIAKIHFVGDGQKLNDYEKQCKSLDLPVYFHRFLARKEVFQIYKQADFFLLPSSASEGFPKAIAEAMNYGCLPIVSSVSSIGHYVDGNNGFIVKPCTSDNLLTILNAVLDHKSDELRKMAIDAHQTVFQFTFEYYRSRILNDVIV